MVSINIWTIDDIRLVPRPPLTAFFAAMEKRAFFHGCKKAAREGLGTRLCQLTPAEGLGLGQRQGCHQVWRGKINAADDEYDVIANVLL